MMIYFIKFIIIVGKPTFSDQFKKMNVIKKIGIQHGHHATVCIPGCKPNHGL